MVAPVACMVDWEWCSSQTSGTGHKGCHEGVGVVGVKAEKRLNSLLPSLSVAAVHLVEAIILVLRMVLENYSVDNREKRGEKRLL